MELPFEKLHGLGNDFIFFDDMDGSLELTCDQVRWLCDRHEGIGADGVILVRSVADDSCDAYMHYINADGTLAQMCGNGVRCFAKFLVDHGMVADDATGLVAETLAGPRPIRFTRDEEGRLALATVSMGAPVLDPALVPVDAVADAVSAEGIPFVGSLLLESPWGPFSFACVSMGNPHAVCFVDDWGALPDALFADPADKRLETLDVARVGAFFESHGVFPEKANIEFAEVRPGGIAMRVYERGCGETQACGTGACATAVAAALSGRAARSSEVRLLGGTLAICWDDEGMVSMTGPAARSFTGTVTL